MPERDADAAKGEPASLQVDVQRRYPAAVRFCGLCGAALKERLLLDDNDQHWVCAGCGFVFFPGPQLVAGCLIVREGKVLLLRRGAEPERGKWTFPAGYVDFGETPAATAERETLEEVRMHVRVGRLLDLYAVPTNPHAVVAVYLAEPGDEEPSATGEAPEVRYFAPDDLPWNDLAFGSTHAALRDWLGRRCDTPAT
jgi:ADP-ribose pyrophosphatase YjhB (NUDIX family)